MVSVGRLAVLCSLTMSMLLGPQAAVRAETTGWSSWTGDILIGGEGTYASHDQMHAVAAAKASGSYGVNAIYAGVGAASASAAVAEKGTIPSEWRGPPWRVTFSYSIDHLVTATASDYTSLYFYRPYSSAAITPSGWAAPYLEYTYCDWTYGYQCYTEYYIDYDAAEYVYAGPMACAPTSSYCTNTDRATYSVDVGRSASYPQATVIGIYFEIGFLVSAVAYGESEAKAEVWGSGGVTADCIYC